MVAIDEVGLDYWMVKTDKDRELQRLILHHLSSCRWNWICP